MKKCSLLFCILLAVMLPQFPAWGQLSSYIFTAGTGDSYSMTGATTFINGTAGSRWGNKNRTSSINPIGFSFNFAGVDYTTFSISANGVMSLGASTVTNTPSNYLTSGTFPQIAPFWDDLYMGGGDAFDRCITPNITYVTQGSAPTRVLVVEWKDVNLYWYYSWGTNTAGTFQVRLYESSNKIEFYYGRMNPCGVCGGGCYSTSATIGLAASASQYIAVTPAGGNAATISRVSQNDYYNINSGTSIPQGTLYTFLPCNLKLTGRLGPNDGGTVGMTNGDVFFNGFVEQVGSSAVYRPFTIQVSDASCSRNYTLTISGTNAADYYFGTPGTQVKSSSITGTRLDTIGITFKPLGTGVRNATLTVTDGAGFTRTYSLAARAPLVNYMGNIPQGGTTKMASGDTILLNFRVRRNTSQNFTPFTLTNVSPSSQTISYILNDPTGQYSITPGGPLAAGASTTPILTFAPTGFGPQRAMLTVNAGGETRSFILYGISEAPGGEFSITGNLIDSTSTLFLNSYSCSGEQANTIAITVKNVGYNDYLINSAEFYRIDTTYAQGRPRYPFVRDAQGALVPLTDYVLTETPGVAPIAANSVNFPIVVPEGTSKTLYLTFVAQMPQKRFARAYFRTNGENVAGTDTNGVRTEGLLNFEVYGRGSGSRLSDNLTNGGLPKAVIFPETKIGESSEATLTLANPGICPLRVSLPELMITAGDVDEFKIVQTPSTGIDPVTGDLVLAPGTTESVRIRFSPTQFGSRRAGMRLMTNDSTIETPAITERGVYYVDLFGTGKADLYAESVDFGQALIGGTGADQITKTVRVKNTLNGPIIITKMIFDGVDTSEFEKGGTGWPGLPYVLNGGQELNIPVVFGPDAGGQPGPRSAMVKFITSTGDTIVANLTGVAGTRTINVTPTTINVTVSAGKLVRRVVEISNTGTMPLTVQQPVMSPGSDFTNALLPRLVLAPGQKEYLEISYNPQSSGTSSATLTISSNGTNGTNGQIQVQLNGTAPKTKLGDPDPSSLTIGRNDGPVFDGVVTPGGENLNASGVTNEEVANGMALRQSVPNPGRDLVGITYWLANGADTRLELFDGSGKLIQVLDAGYRQAGEQVVRVDIRNLANGVYHYRLSSGGRTISRTMTVAR